MATKLCIEQRKNLKNNFSQRQSNSYQYYFIYITLSMGFYSLLEQPKYTSLVLFVQVSTSFLLFIYIHFEKPFYVSCIQKCWSIISGITFYTNFMLLFSYFFESIIFQDTMLGWLVSTPMLALILMKEERSSINILEINLRESSSGTEIIEKCDFLLDLIVNYEKNEKKEILLSGFIEIHKYHCKNLNCAINVNQILARKFGSNPKYRDKKYVIIELINQFFEEGLAKLPTNANLRINYAYFLQEHMGQSYKAQSQLVYAEDLNPSFDQQFMIYRFKKIIEEQILTSSTNSGLQKTLTTNKTYSSQIQQFQQLIEECSYQHYYFWNQLMEETPNLQILDSLGMKIIKCKGKIKKQYTQLSQSKVIGSKSYRLIQKLYQNVYHEDFQHNQSSQFKNIHPSNGYDYDKYIQDQGDLSGYSFPVLLFEIFSDFKKETIIKNINLGVHAILGFSKADLINKQIATIFPDIFLQIHNSTVESYFSDNLDETVNYSQEKLIFLRNKSNYIVPIQSTNVIFTAEKGFLQFFRIPLDISHNCPGYILFDLEGNIENISSSCIIYLQLSERIVSSRSLTIQQLFPTLLFNKCKYLEKMNLICYQGLPNSMSKSFEFEDHMTDEERPSSIMCQLFELSNQYFQKAQERCKVFGYLLKIENSTLELLSYKSVVKQSNHRLQFRFQVEEKKYLMESMSPTASQVESGKVDSSVSYEQPANALTCLSFPSKKQFSMSQFSTPKYGGDIKTYRLFEGRLIEVSELDEEEYEESELKELTKKLEDQHNQENFYPSITITNKEQLMELLENSKISLSVSLTIISSNFLILVLLFLSLLMYIILSQVESEFKITLSVLSASNLRYGQILKIQSNLQDLRGCNLQFEQQTQTMTGGIFVKLNKGEMMKELNLLIQSNTLLTASKIQISDKYQSVIDDFENPNIQVRSKNGGVEYFQYSELVQQLISKAITLNNSDIEEIKSNNEDFYFYIYNSFNSIPRYQHISQNYYYYNIVSLIEKLNNYQNAFFISSSICIVLIFTSLQIYIQANTICILVVLKLFLELNERQIKKYSEQAQQFIQQLQFDEEDEFLETEKVDELDNEVDFLKRNKKKSYSYLLKDHVTIQVHLLIFLILVFSYFCYLYFSSITITDQTISLIPLVNLTSYLPAHYRLIDNGLKEMLFDETTVILNQVSSITLINQFIKQGYDLNADIHILNQQNEDYLLTPYKDSFFHIYFQNPCDIITSYDSTVNYTSCIDFNGQVLQDGLAIAIANFLENTRYLLQEYSIYNPQMDQTNFTYNFSNDPKINYTENLLNTKKEYSNRKLQKVFIRACHMYLQDKLEEYLSDHYSELQLQLAALFLVFYILSLLICLFIWIPFQRSMYNQVYKSRRLLQIIPLKHFQQSEPLQQYLKKISSGN